MKKVTLLIVLLLFAVTASAKWPPVNSTVPGTDGQCLINSSGNVGAQDCFVAGGPPANATYITQLPSSGLSAEQALSLLATGLMNVATGSGQITSFPPTDDTLLVGEGTVWQSKVLNDCTGENKALTYVAATNSFGCNTIIGGGGTGAPTDATYLTKTANGDLSAEQALASLSTGLMNVTTGTGDVTSFVPTNNTVLVGNSTAWESKAVADCTGVDRAVIFDAATNTWGCNVFSGFTVLPRANGGVCDAVVTTLTGTAIQAAIDALPASGGDICLVAGTYVVDTAISIGNGTTSALSTRGGVYIHGITPPVTKSFISYAYAEGTTLDCTGFTGVCIFVKGPLSGWGVENLAILGNNVGSQGVNVTSGQDGYARNLYISGMGYGTACTTHATWTGPGTNWDCIHNVFENVNMHLIAGGVAGIWCHGNADGANCDFNHFTNFEILGADATPWCIYLGWADTNQFDNIHCATAFTTALLLDYTAITDRGPISNSLRNFEPFTGAITVLGTADANKPNKFYGYGDANGATCPVDKDGILIYGCIKDTMQEVHYRAIAAPTTPGTGYTVVYADSTSKQLCSKDDAGTVRCIGGMASPTFSTAWAFGDSVTIGGAGETTPYIPLVASYFGATITNYALGGSYVADQAEFIYARTPIVGSNSIYALSIGDSHSYGVGGDQTHYIRGTLAELAYLALQQNGNFIKGQALTTGGTWTNSALYGGTLSRQSATNASTLTGSVYGKHVLVQYTAGDSYAGTASITVDGVACTTFTSVPGGVIDTPTYHTTTIPQLAMCLNLADKLHTVLVTVTSSTSADNVVVVDWIAGTGGPGDVNGPNVYVLSSPRQTPAWHVTNGGSDADTTRMNEILVNSASLLASLGLNVSFGDVTGALNVTTDMLGDGIHPSDAGHAKIASVLERLIQPYATPQTKQGASHPVVSAKQYLDKTEFYGETDTSFALQATVNGSGVLLPASKYVQFGTVAGSSGYGVRDNSGTIECKNSGGSWAACGSGGSGGDLVSPLVSSEVVITNANTTLTISKMHVITATTGATTNELPTCSGNTDKLIGVRISLDSTKLVTIKGSGSELIDNLNTRIMHHGESAILKCDGTNSHKIAGRSILMSATIYLTTNQAIATGSLDKVLLDASSFDSTGLMVDTTNHRLVIQRPGTYAIEGVSSFTNVTAAGARFITSLQAVVSGAGIAQIASAEQTAITGGYPSPFAKRPQITLAAADYAELFAYHDVPVTSQYVHGDGIEQGGSYLSVTEVTTW